MYWVLKRNILTKNEYEYIAHKSKNFVVGLMLCSTINFICVFFSRIYIFALCLCLSICEVINTNLNKWKKNNHGPISWTFLEYYIFEKYTLNIPLGKGWSYSRPFDVIYTRHFLVLHWAQVKVCRTLFLRCRFAVNSWHWEDIQWKTAKT